MIRMKYFLHKKQVGPSPPPRTNSIKPPPPQAPPPPPPPCAPDSFTVDENGFQCHYDQLPPYTKHSIGYTTLITNYDEIIPLQPTFTKHPMVSFQVPDIGVWLIQLNIHFKQYTSIPTIHYSTIDTFVPMKFPLHRMSDSEYICFSTFVLPVVSLTPWYDVFYCAAAEEQTIHTTITILATRIG